MERFSNKSTRWLECRSANAESWNYYSKAVKTTAQGGGRVSHFCIIALWLLLLKFFQQFFVGTDNFVLAEGLSQCDGFTGK